MRGGERESETGGARVRHESKGCGEVVGRLRWPCGGAVTS